MLLVHKIRDARFQLLLRRWTFVLFAEARTRQAKIERPATGYGSILSAISNLPSLTVTTSPGFDAFRCVSNEIRPVTPSKSAVFANASRTAAVSIVPAR